jgi:hypothetical protein
LFDEGSSFLREAHSHYLRSKTKKRSSL